ncbi:MAG: Flp pilus assembly protein CpaB [Actinobacteria bacterium 13_1_20CM_2_65_11]|nr:MAG: Flp pilus assembly protein CpaB [Chloroflexi bacterium 13_1_40CM_65_17]OLC67395.1 MAG: Flp pilus assembly protein CpaB [Actinobacteria bacterium 13_1_40CM_4_65_12]OLD23405.1 MAG: Flp pilus assembly protein CpaB [Chloroflexi bacterium 13_1_40CM_3_65_12]OLD46262.1 MAG: Flp pilus assembly protein CpaB [Chloroflexi bacterium 13_1_40CM_2_68_14]OLE78732.1 MAG: Flp pilus assembly protein CpaB [Actinobacteria bacterium 13_1_20CM_2_65_11]
MSIFRGLTSRRPFTLLGIVLALVVIGAFVLVALNASTGSSVPMQSVVVATQDLQPRLPIAADALEIKRVPVLANYPPVFFDRVSNVQGMVPLVTILSGQAITSNEVVKPSQALGSQSEYLPIPSGYVALTIPTSEQQGVADYIQPGDYISVIATVSTNAKVASKTIFTNLHVIKVGTSSASTNSAATSLTVVVTQCQAEIITWFLTYAALKYSLESFHDYLQSTNQSKDPACPSVDAAQGVTLQAVQKAYPTLF